LTAQVRLVECVGYFGSDFAMEMPALGHGEVDGALLGVVVRHRKTSTLRFPLL
jgi:hypothetical protein